MKDEIKEYPKEQQELKNYLDNVTIEKIIEKLKDDDSMTWWVDYQDQYQPVWKKLYSKEVKLLLEYITSLEDKIDKAIEFIKKNSVYYDITGENELYENCDIIIDILKGSDK